MSVLYVYHVSSLQMPHKVLTHAEDITSTLAELGVTFARWSAASPLSAGASQDDVIRANRAELDRIMTERGLAGIDVLSVNDTHPDKVPLRAGLLVEQQARTEHVRLIGAGRGLLNLHIGDYVYGVVCEKNDRIDLPAGTSHWFDMGEAPHVVVIRLLKDTHDGTPTATGQAIADSCVRLEDC